MCITSFSKLSGVEQGSLDRVRTNFENGMLLHSYNIPALSRKMYSSDHLNDAKFKAKIPRGFGGDSNFRLLLVPICYCV